MPIQEKEILTQWHITEYKTYWVHNEGLRSDWSPTITQGRFVPEERNASLREDIENFTCETMTHENTLAIRCITNIITAYTKPPRSAQSLQASLSSDYFCSQKKYSTRFAPQGTIHCPQLFNDGGFSGFSDFSGFNAYGREHHFLYEHSPPTGKREEYTYKTYSVRPYIEKLFFDEKLSTFADLVDSLLVINEDAFYQAFIASLVNTDILEDSLFLWDASLKNAVLHQLTLLKTHGESLQNPERRQQVLDLVAELSAMLSNKNNIHPEKITCENQFKKLKFKLDFLKKLHRYDTALSTHQDYTRLIANLATILFPPLAIANVIYKIATNKWLFFNTTATENEITRMHATVQFRSVAKIC